VQYREMELSDYNGIIVLAYAVAFISFVWQLQAGHTESTKGVQAFSLAVCLLVAGYVLLHAKAKLNALAVLPAIMLSVWSGVKVIALYAALFVPVLLGGHAP